MTANPETGLLRSVLFLPGSYYELFSGNFPYDQLDAIGEILDLANSYVLNDSVAVTGMPFRLSSDSFGRFVESEIESSDAIESIGDGERYRYDIGPFDEALGIPEYERRLKTMKQDLENYEDSLANRAPEPDEEREIRVREKNYQAVAEEARVLQQRSYIVLADSLQATYVPERLYGRKALQSYAEVLVKAPHAIEEEFRKRLAGEIDSLGTATRGLGVRVPSFFVEALRQSETQDGIWHALRDLRHSRAAETYRSLARVVTDETKPLNERQEARQELRQRSEAVFSGESLKSRIPRWLKFTVALSPIAVGVLFPAAALASGAAPVLLEALDEADRWFRRRANIFDLYAEAVNVDMYGELKRLFPNIKFQPGHLAHYLRERNFGWSEALDHELYSGWLGRSAQP